jgi:hypothetical protein
MSATGNPYATSGSWAGEVGPLAPDRDPWKQMAWRWERWRLPYTAAVFVAGAAGLIIGGRMLDPVQLIGGAVAWGAAANVAYCFGVLVELYASGLADWMTDRRVSPELAPLVRYPLSRPVLWPLGTIFAVGVTFVAAVLGF